MWVEWKLERGPGLKMLTHMPVIWVSPDQIPRQKPKVGGLWAGSWKVKGFDEGSETEKERRQFRRC